MIDRDVTSPIVREILSQPKSEEGLAQAAKKNGIDKTNAPIRLCNDQRGMEMKFWGAIFIAIFCTGLTACAKKKMPYADFSCANGDSLRVQFLNDSSSMLLSVNDTPPLTLQKGMSASGVRYQSTNLEFWEHQGEIRWTTPATTSTKCVASSKAPPRSVVKIANPASVYCDEVGGRIQNETRPDGAEYGVCLFDDNRQCGQWALFRNECPIGGVKVTGYWTNASRFCAVTGGAFYLTSAATTAEPEQGNCILPSGKICDVHAYFSGQCR